MKSDDVIVRYRQTCFKVAGSTSIRGFWHQILGGSGALACLACRLHSTMALGMIWGHQVEKHLYMYIQRILVIPCQSHGLMVMISRSQDVNAFQVSEKGTRTFILL